MKINSLSREQIVLALLVVVIIIGISILLINEQLSKAVIVSTVSEKNVISNEINEQNEVLLSNNTVEEVEKEDQRIIIHIAGEVKQSGVYELPGDARVIDAVMAAGGETSYADLDSMNLASPVFDGEKIYVPSIIETKLSDESYASGNKLSSTGASSNKININKASSKELEELPGIGPSKASSIIDYRDEIGRFSDLEQLTAVSGIGEKTLQKIKNKISVR
ncbi:hypothetical protein GM661_08090 [Iocasia frigidifontis]|uniref:Helix-hairpin-helix DNA-binding motif class 1 domain-containing protein n=1 Tax=Iocasia fonsfrigidae TaxID=2682810 RepID=A0A8A7K9N6_9FIRM|nr:helix-hairpin-helix domain-containing protein [Iocasia fonsfrigidae]QTL97940.1 hypothetical protein GM661_08090 [Iocasia fonsfrigidae]